MDGYKTYAGLVITILGMFHLGDIFGSEQIANFVNVGFEFAGAIIALVGNWHAHEKIKDLKAQAMV